MNKRGLFSSPLTWLIIALLIVFYFSGLFSTGSLLWADGSLVGQGQLVGSVPGGYHYNHFFSSSAPAGEGTLFNSHTFKFIAPAHSNIIIPSDALVGVSVRSYDVTISGLSAVNNPNTDLESSADFVLTDVYSDCSLENAYIAPSGSVPSELRCEYHFTMSSTDDEPISVRGGVAGSTDITIPSIGSANSQGSCMAGSHQMSDGGCMKGNKHIPVLGDLYYYFSKFFSRWF